MAVFTEEINLSSILTILLEDKGKRKLICYRTDYNNSSFFINILKFLSVDFELLEQDKSYAGLGLKSFNEFELSFQKNYVVPNLSHQLRILDKDIYKREKSLRHLSYLCSENLSVHLEFVLEALRQDCNMVMLRKTPHTKIIESFCKDNGIKTKSYRKLLSRTSSIRKTYYRDQILLKFSSTKSIARAIKKIFHIWHVFFKFILNLLFYKGQLNGIPKTLAIVHHPPSDYFNELFWSKDYRNNGKNVLGLLDRKMSKEDLNKVKLYTDFTLHNVEEFGKYLSMKGKLSSLINILKVLSFFFWKLATKKIRFFIFAELIIPFIYSKILSKASQECNIKAIWTSVEGGDPLTFSVSLVDESLKTYGTSWSMPYCESYRHNIYRNDVFFNWGDRHKKFFLNSGSDIKEFCETGYPINNEKKLRSVEFKEKFHKYSGIREDLKIITYFDNLCADDLPVTKQYSADFLFFLFQFLDNNLDYSLIIKSKKDDFEKNYGDFKSSLQMLRKNSRLLIETSLADYSYGMVSDLNLCISSSSPLLVCAGYGAKTLIFDPDGYCKDLENEKGVNLFSFSDPENLEEMILRAIDHPSQRLDFSNNKLTILGKKTASQIVSDTLTRST